MKKIRIASLLLVLVLATSCFVGTTFAKYTAGDQNADTARVAEWGVSVEYTPVPTSGVVADGFDETYALDSTGTGLALAVQSETKVVAPGTKGTFGTFTVEGSPEVAVLVTKNMTVDLGDNWNVVTDDKGNDDPADDVKAFYCPITFKIDGATINGLDHTTVESLEGALVDAFQGDNGGATKYYEPNATNLGDLTIDGFTWEWAFEDATGTINQTDAYDTQLGNLFETTGAPSISITYSIGIDQVN